MGKSANHHISGFGVTICRGGHKDIRKLKRLHAPSTYGHRVWPTSWLLADFIHNEFPMDGLRIMDVGCGWGLAGIYCAKNHAARVTCVDMDPAVFPFLEHNCTINEVSVTTLSLPFEGLMEPHLEGVDLLIGADICFWDELVAPLKGLIDRACSAGVREILLADPGRQPFDDLSDLCRDEHRGRAINWHIRRPQVANGRILKIGTLR